jgi:hypothetical protein
MLQDETERKAKYYYVANLREARIWALRIMGKSHDQEKFDELLKSMGKQVLKKSKDRKELGKIEYEEISKILSQSIYTDIDKEFDEYKNKKNLIHEPAWYNLLKIKSIRNLAEKIKRLPEYEFFYGIASDVVHTSKYRDHIRTQNGKLFFKRIRTLEGIREELDYLIPLTLRNYIMVLEHYRPDEVENFKKKFNDKWKNILLKIPSTTYDIEDIQI